MRLAELEARLSEVHSVLAEKRKQLSQHDAEVESLKKQQDSVNRWVEGTGAGVVWRRWPKVSQGILRSLVGCLMLWATGFVWILKDRK